MNATLCDNLSRMLVRLYRCEDLGEYHRVYTPCLYPDGDGIEVFCKTIGKNLVISDLGETANWLLSNTFSDNLSDAQLRLIGKIAATHGVVFEDGHIRTEVPMDDLAEGVSRVAQAAARASDVSFTFKPRTLMRTTDDVAEFLERNAIKFDRTRPVEAETGHTYTIDFATHAHDRECFVNVLTAPSRQAARTAYQKTLAAWYDLGRTPSVRSPKRQFVSLFDDTDGLWRAGDFEGLRDLSDVVRWSSPGTFLSAITGKAA